MTTGIPDRVPVQGDGPYWLSPDSTQRRRYKTHEPGTISREEYLRAWEAYDRKWHSGQSAERMIQRGGFSYFELVDLLGGEPSSFVSTETGGAS